MRISDWSSDVCSSDLKAGRGVFRIYIIGKARAERILQHRKEHQSGHAVIGWIPALHRDHFGPMALPNVVKASRYVRKCLFPATGFELTGRTGSAQRLDEPVRVVGHVDHALRLYAEKSLGNDVRGIAAHCYHPIILDRDRTRVV